ncbi:MAG: hypothetical protein E7K72_20235, partial [Roseomonas mucosa]|nr:hypothetical protein [Roseomonas mucosa]
AWLDRRAERLILKGSVSLNELAHEVRDLVPAPGGNSRGRLRTMLQRDGWRVAEAGDGRAGLELVTRSLPSRAWLDRRAERLILKGSVSLNELAHEVRDLVPAPEENSRERPPPAAGRPA